MSSFKYRRGTSFNVSFPTAPSLVSKPERVELIQRQYEHDVMVLEYQNSSSLWFSTLKTGTPIVFTWSKDSQAHSWIGYVINVSKTSAGERKRPMKIFCIGPSYVLKARASRNFKNVTVTDVARTIAKEFKLNFVGENSTRKFPQLSMTGQSYWQWLQEQAARIGYGMYVRGATLYLRPLDKIINEGMSYAAIMTLQPPLIPADGQFLDKTLDNFEILNGDFIENGEAANSIKATSGVNPLTGKHVNGSQDPNKTGQKMRRNTTTAIFTEYTNEVVHSAALGKQAAKDLAEAARFTTPAKISGQGDHRLVPYNVAYLEGTGVDTDGYWLVKETKHIFLLTGKYQIEASVITDGIGANVVTAFRTARPNQVGTINVEEKLLRDLTQNKNSSGSPRLISKMPAILQGQQGFAQLGSVWSGK
jgi:phage protein D|tara:strand:- start:53 stop:1309 length:1257 start_codon:yes stop_codon:yes gene_type:complete